MVEGLEGTSEMTIVEQSRRTLTAEEMTLAAISREAQRSSLRDLAKGRIDKTQSNRDIALDALMRDAGLERTRHYDSVSDHAPRPRAMRLR